MKRLHVINGTLDKNFKPAKKKYALGVQAVKPTPQPPNPGADAAGVLGGAATGFATAGPVGGIVGGVTGLISALGNNKARKAENAQQQKQYEQDQLAYLQSTVLDPNELPTQLNQAAQGIRYAAGTKEVEVERDELIFTKSPTGKYILKDDFYGGKSHAQGGEDYVVAEGDIIFPGKDRKKVMKAYKAQDFPKLESMRLSLPKDTNIAQNGLDHTDPKKPGLGSKSKTTAYLKEQLDLGNITPQQYAELGGQGPDKSVFANPPSVNELNPLSNSRLTNMEINPWDKRPATFNSNTTYQDVPLIQETPELTPPTPKGKKPFPTKTGGSALTDPGAASGITDIPNLSNLQPGGIDVARANQIGSSMTQLQQAPELQRDFSGAQNIAGYVGQAAGALANLFPGQAEVQQSPLVNLKRNRYQDTSESLRQQSIRNERLQASNARNAAGGNVQNYLQNRNMAGLQNLQNLQKINAQEFARSQGIANQNIGISNREAMLNNQIRRGDQDVNAANRGARRNSVITGVGQLGQLAGVAGRDRNANINQEELMRTLNSMGGFEVLADGSIALKQS